jgi:hypothetical protein
MSLNILNDAGVTLFINTHINHSLFHKYESYLLILNIFNNQAIPFTHSCFNASHNHSFNNLYNAVSSSSHLIVLSKSVINVDINVITIKFPTNHHAATEVAVALFFHIVN